MLNCPENTGCGGLLPHSRPGLLVPSLSELGSDPRACPFCCQFMWCLCSQSYLGSNLKANPGSKNDLTPSSLTQISRSAQRCIACFASVKWSKTHLHHKALLYIFNKLKVLGWLLWMLASYIMKLYTDLPYDKFCEVHSFFFSTLLFILYLLHIYYYISRVKNTHIGSKTTQLPQQH